MTSCRMPVIQLVAFEDRPCKFIFVRVPDTGGRYVRTDPCVAFAPCPQCGSTIGEPCKSHEQYRGSTHAVRRDALLALRRRGQAALADRRDVIDVCDGATITIK